MARGKILLIDDDIGISSFLKSYFEDREFDVDMAPDGEKGLQKFEKGSFDLVICDMLMPKMIGVNVLKRIKELKPDQKVIMVTGVKEDTLMKQAKELGCHLYLTKPIRLADLESHVAECFPGEDL